MQRLIFLLSVVVLIVVSSANAFAGGDKVRGDEGAGTVHQHQEEDSPLFN